MKHKRVLITIALVGGLVAVMAVLSVLGGVAAPVRADPGVLYVAPGGDCGGMSPCYGSVQAAVDAAGEGDDIKVAAGTYNDVYRRNAPDGYDGSSVITQVVYISKTVAVQGGYTTTNWDTSDPEANLTTLDAQGQGRVLFITGDISPTVKGLRITGGDAKGLGGGQYGSESDGGGGVYVAIATATLRDNEVFGNTADHGGGLYLSGSDATLSDNTVSSNTAGLGGGLCLDESDAILSGNTVSSNTADHGGGLCLDGSDAILSGNTVSSNTADSGGGLSLVGGPPTLNGNIISHNTALQNGGGLALLSSDATLTDNVIADNRANWNGSGLYIKGSSPRLLHTTIVRNIGGYGSGIYIADNYFSGAHNTVVLTNTIIVGHAVGISVWMDGNTVTLEGTLWGSGSWANGKDWEGAVITGTVNIWDDPAFVDPDGGDYHIGPTSPARDAGINVGVGHDIDGQVRPMDGVYDIGADEYPGVGLDIVKRSAPVSVSRGQVLTYTIVVTSAGIGEATDVILTDTLDGWQRVTGVVASGGSCAIADADWGGKVSCSLGTMTPGTTAVITLAAQISTAVTPGGALVNTVAVEADETVNSTRVTNYVQDCHVRINDYPTEYTSVQAAVDAANPGDLVKVAGVCRGSNRRSKSLHQQIYVDKSLTIRGGYTVTNWDIPDSKANPTTLDAWGEGRVLYITGDISATIEGLRITGGDAGWWGNGSGVYVNNADVILRANEVFGNNGWVNGGGVYIAGAVATIRDNVVSGNTVVADGGGLYLHESDAIFSGNTIRDNRAGQGGGLYLYYSNAILSGNTINNNTATARYSKRGGGVRLYVSNATLSGNTISNNTANYGGGLYLGSSDAALSGNTITNNKGDGLGLNRSDATLSEDTITNNSGYGLWLRDSDATLTNNVIADNQDSENDSGLYVESSSLQLVHTTIARNRGYYGSGVYVTSNSTVSLTNTILVSQTVGIIVSSDSTVTLEATLWGSGNWANGTDWGGDYRGMGTIVTGTINIWGDPAFANPDSGNYHIGPTSAARDAGINAGVDHDMDGQVRPMDWGYDIGADEYPVGVSGQDCHVRLNDDATEYTMVQAAVDVASPGDLVKVAGVCLGAIKQEGLYQQVYLDKELTIRGGYAPADWENFDPQANPTTLDALGQGRVLYITGEANPTIEGLRLTGGDAEGLGGGPSGSDVGGGVYVASATATIRDNRVFSNTADDGGGLYLYESDATLSENIISGNTAKGTGWWNGGGGLRLENSDATLNDNTISGNSAVAAGGGVVVWGSNSATLNRNAVSGNTAQYGGGVSLSESAATLSGNTVSGNSAEVGGGMSLGVSPATLSGNLISGNTADDGGGLYLYESDATLSENIVSGNTAEGTDWWNGGGGLRLENSDATLSDNIISGNSAVAAGGGMVVWGSNSATLNRNMVSGNTAQYGGGVSLSESAATLSGNTVSDNNAEYGGGLSLGVSPATLSGNLISDNYADHGGGLALYQSDATLTNDVVMNNRASVSGSGMYVEGASPQLLHTTVARNIGGDGSGIHVTEIISDSKVVHSHVALTNTILVNHGVGITVTAGNTATLDGVLWFGNGADTGGAGSVTVTNGITGDPAFAADNYHLTLPSAAFDAGVNASVLTDIDGDARPQGAAPDLGADEIIVVTGNVFTDTETILVYTDTQGLTTTIRIPAGAVTETTLLVYAPMEVQAPSGFAFAGHGFDLEAYWDGERLPGFTFGLPVMVTIRYSEEDVRLVTDESELFLGRWTGSNWENAAETCDPPSSYSRDVEGNEISVPICHLSRFALFGPTRQVYLPLVMREA